MADMPTKVARARPFKPIDTAEPVETAGSDGLDEPGGFDGPSAEARRIRAALELHPTASLVGRFHAAAALAAYTAGEMESAFSHVVDAELALLAEPDPDASTACAWRDLALAQSMLGIPQRAIESLDRGRQLANSHHAHIDDSRARLHTALALDHRGYAEESVRQLELVVDAVSPRPAIAAYASARIRVLCGQTSTRMINLACPTTLPTTNSYDAALRALTIACHEIASGRPACALRMLDGLGVDPRIGEAELQRLRVAALHACGDVDGAIAAGLRVQQLAGAGFERLMQLMVQRTNDCPDRSLLRRALAESRREARTDPLTGLPNRRELDRRLARLMESGAGAAVAMIDVDRFNEINTTYGHVVGDEVLRRVGRSIASVLRAEDFVARYGGDEFVVLLPGRDLECAGTIGARMAQEIARAGGLGLMPDREVGVTIGWARSDRYRAAHDVLAAADRAMYAGKSHRRRT
jgi:diguanylate cyclase (GGDEF)-like protein